MVALHIRCVLHWLPSLTQAHSIIPLERPGVHLFWVNVNSHTLFFFLLYLLYKIFVLQIQENIVSKVFHSSNRLIYTKVDWNCYGSYLHLIKMPCPPSVWGLLFLWGATTWGVGRTNTLNTRNPLFHCVSLCQLKCFLYFMLISSPSVSS